jgi:hypothetical protein
MELLEKRSNDLAGWLNWGYEYKSEMLQTPDEETLRSESHDDIMENCPNCKQILSYTGPDFYWE